MLLSLKDLRQRSGYSVSTWRAWVRDGRVPVVRLGRLIRVHEDDFHRLLEESRVPARESGRTT